MADQDQRKTYAKMSKDLDDRRRESESPLARTPMLDPAEGFRNPGVGWRATASGVRDGLGDRGLSADDVPLATDAGAGVEDLRDDRGDVGAGDLTP